MPVASALKCLSNALSAAVACRGFLDSDSLDSPDLDELVLFRLREEVGDLISGIEISKEIVKRRARER